MPPRQTIPADDLYARLGVPHDASPETIDLAWRGLLRRHHPDVAGEDGTELAKRINVAHDWLSDAALRARYDDERGNGPPGAGRRATDGRPMHSTRARRRREPTLAERLATVVERAHRLSVDELERLALAEPAPIAFLATLRRFAPDDIRSALEAAEAAAIAGLPTDARDALPIRDAIAGRLAEIALGEVLDDLLGESGSDRARERLTRGWDSAIGQPRYGPATPEVTSLIARLRRLTGDQRRALADSGSADRLGDAPWPPAMSPDDDDALRVSSELAGIDAVEAIGGSRAPIGARRAVARIAHLVVLRPAFTTTEFDRHARPWTGSLITRRRAGT